MKALCGVLTGLLVSLPSGSVTLAAAPVAADPAKNPESSRYIDLGKIGKACGITQVGIYPDMTTLVGTIFLILTPLRLMTSSS